MVHFQIYLIIPKMSSIAVIPPNPGSKLGCALHFKNYI